MKAILELEIKLREQADPKSNGEQPKKKTKKEIIKPIIETKVYYCITYYRLIQSLQTPTVKPPQEVERGRSIKTSVIMSTPDFAKQIKTAPKESPAAESPDIIKPDRVRDPVIEVNENSLPLPSAESSDHSTQTVTSERDEAIKSDKKVTLNPFIMDEAISSLM